MQKDTSSFRAATILNLLLSLTASPDCPLDVTRVAATTRVTLLRDAPVEGDGPIGLLSARAAARTPLHELQNMCSSTCETRRAGCSAYSSCWTARIFAFGRPGIFFFQH
jgi:hypothetical protein